MYNKDEKLAILKAVIEVSIADGIVSWEEKAYLGHLISVLDLKKEYGAEAALLNMTDCVNILSRMSDEQKSGLIIMLHEMANADGVIDNDELQTIAGVFLAAGIKI
jgi:uncharacterized tellurite resistance protein B-like protein